MIFEIRFALSLGSWVFFVFWKSQKSGTETIRAEHLIWFKNQTFRQNLGHVAPLILFLFFICDQRLYFTNVNCHMCRILRVLNSYFFLSFNGRSVRVPTPQDGDILVDYSKNRVDSAAMALLLNLARNRGVEQARDAMFTGEQNHTCLHTIYN